MKLTIVGCSGSYAGPDSPASCYLLEHEGFRFVLDLGSGALGALQRHIDPRTIDAIAVTHLHPDHCIDMTGLHVMAKYHPDGPYPTIDVWGPVGTAEFMQRANGVDGDPMTDAFAFHRWHEFSTVRIGPFTVTAFPGKHPVPEFSLRIETGGAVLAYTGDTGPHEQIVDLARDADVFLSEASFVESRRECNPPDLHLTGAEAAEYALRAGASRLLITHVPAWIDAAEVAAEVDKVFPGPHELVRAGQVIEF